MKKILNIFANTVVAGISERLEGDMRIAKGADLELTQTNRKRFFEKSELLGFETAAALLEHGEKALFVHNPGIYEADGLVTDNPKLLLTVTVADCMPIFLLDSRQSVIALAHAGRLGLQKGIIQETLRLMFSRSGSRPENIICYFGPFICESHHPTNLKEEATKQLQSQGVASEQIFDANLCTYELPEDFFSYRRDRPKVPEAQVAFMGLLQ